MSGSDDEEQREVGEIPANPLIPAEEIEALRQRLAELTAREDAIRSILRAIASSPADLQSVLDTVAESAAHLCAASDVTIVRVDGNAYRVIAHFGSIPPAEGVIPLRRGSVVGRTILDGRTRHVEDLAALAEDEYPDSRVMQRRIGDRTLLATPLVREGIVRGAMVLRRREVQPFTDRQIALLETFADQAVIAIENTRLFQELDERNRDVSEALEQQTATSEVLRVIARSPTDLQAVLDAVAENAAALCEADDAIIHRVDGELARLAAKFGSLPFDSIGQGLPINRGSAVGRAIVDREPVHTPDIELVPDDEQPDAKAFARRYGIRAILAVPLLRQGAAIGTIAIRRTEPRAFSEKQIDLLKTFADQAVIAIENTRLFRELDDRNRDLTEALARESEALEQQTAMSEVLRVIASSPTDLQAVLDTVAENAARLCGADDALIRRVDGDSLRTAAHHGSLEIARESYPIDPGAVAGRAVLERRTMHVPDLLTEPEGEFPFHLARSTPIRTLLVTPLLSQGVAIGTITIRRLEVNPFTDQQIALLETFADQAVIAIENARLFRELEERNRDLTQALEQQTATGEVLRAIASSPTNLQKVLDVVAETAAHVCGALDALIWQLDGDRLRQVAHFGPVRHTLAIGEAAPLDPSRVFARAVLERQTIHLHDIQAEEAEFAGSAALARTRGVHTVVVAPLLREGRAIGAIHIRRREVQPFAPKEITLLQSFADQAVIAIENARLFQELQDRNRDLTESLAQQTATSEVLRVIASSPTDLQTVLDTLAENAARLCDSNDAILHRAEGDMLRLVAHYGPLPVASDREFFPIAGSTSAPAMLQRRSIQVEDVSLLPDEYASVRERAERTGWRTNLVVPLLRQGVPIGDFGLRRTEVRPFSDAQIALLETFADQAVIAIENARLFQELEDRNNDLSESLEQQTATSEVLRVIASSPTDLQAVLDTVAENAARLCEASDAVIRRVDATSWWNVAHYGNIPTGVTGEAAPIARDGIIGRAILDRRTVHVEDQSALSEAQYPRARAAQRLAGARTNLTTPLLRQGVPIGVISLRRTEVRPFTDKQIALLETFADQAVIAIENARLFGELEDRTRELAQSVEELEALGAVSQAVSSTLDLQEVLTTVLRHAVDLSDMDGGSIFEFDDATGEFHERATLGLGVTQALRAAPLHIGEGMLGRAVLERQPDQVADIVEEGAYEGPMRDVLVRAGYRAMLAVPLFREDQIIGGLVVRRGTPGEVPAEQVALLQTFASQSALAIQNARLFAEIEDKSRQLELASQHKSQFLANMSHELRTPLNAILGYTELILDEIYGDVPGKIRETLERVENSGRHLLGLINDVLDLSKMEAGQLVLSFNDYSLADVVQTVQTAMESLASEKGIGLRTEVAQDLPMGFGDDRRLTQVLMNLVGNAIKFTDEGEVVIRASAQTDDGRPKIEGDEFPGSTFSVAVIDTGPGISQANQAAIFEEFQQADTSSTREKGGTGLGLSIARRIVEMHGGRIWVESTEGQGSTFAFTIPARVEVLI